MDKQLTPVHEFHSMWTWIEQKNSFNVDMDSTKMRQEQKKISPLDPINLKLL